MWFNDNYDLKELEEKLNRCKNMKLENVTLDDVDELGSIKIDRRKSSNERNIRFYYESEESFYIKNSIQNYL